jgi:hypothetical protein
MLSAEAPKRGLAPRMEQLGEADSSCGRLCAVFLLFGDLYANPLRTVALSGQPAPGTAAGLAFDHLSAPQLDASGRTMFSGNVAGAGITSENDTGIWIERGGNLTLVLREGEAAPGFPSGTTFASLFAIQNADMNRRGDIVVFSVARQSAGGPLASGRPSGDRSR